MFTGLEIWEYRPEMRAFTYFRWRFNNWEISFYRQRNGVFQVIRIDRINYTINGVHTF